MKKIIVSLSIIGAVSAIVIGVTTAFFSDVETSVGSFTAGTIDISVDNENPWVKTYPMTLDKPSQTNYVNFKIKNDGSNDANVWKRLTNIINSPGNNIFCGASSEPEYVAGGGEFDGSGVCTGSSYIERDALSPYMIYDMSICYKDPNLCEVDGDGKPVDGSGWVTLIAESNQIRVDNVDQVWIALGMLAAGKEMVVSQSYHLTAWDDANEPMVSNWAQGDTMTFNIELEARQTSAGAPGSDNNSKILNLVQKDATTWIAGGATGTLTYNGSGATFDYVLSASGLEPSTEYALIYYADPWNGLNSELIGTATSDGGSVLSLSDSKDFNHDLPILSDANYPVGAKIWLVLAADFIEGTGMTAWNPSKYLFETNLIQYHDIP